MQAFHFHSEHFQEVYRTTKMFIIIYPADDRLGEGLVLLPGGSLVVFHGHHADPKLPFLLVISAQLRLRVANLTHQLDFSICTDSVILKEP